MCCSVLIAEKLWIIIVLKGVVMAKSVFICSFVDSEAYHEQMGPIPSSNGSDRGPNATASI